MSNSPYLACPCCDKDMLWKDNLSLGCRSCGIEIRLLYTKGHSEEAMREVWNRRVKAAALTEELRKVAILTVDLIHYHGADSDGVKARLREVLSDCPNAVSLLEEDSVEKLSCSLGEDCIENILKPI